MSGQGVCLNQIHSSSTATLTIKPKNNGELFKIIQKKENEKLNCSVIWVRFESQKGIFETNKGKLYAYCINTPPEYSRIQIGTIFNMCTSTGEYLYAGARMRCENIIGFNTKTDAEMFCKRQLKSVYWIKVFYQSKDSLRPRVKHNDGNPISYNGVSPEEYFFCSRRSITSDIILRVSQPNRHPWYNNDNQFNIEDMNTSFPVVTESTIIPSKNVFVDKDVPYYTSPNDTKSWVVGTSNLDTNENHSIKTPEENIMNTNIFGNAFKNLQFGQIKTNDIKYSFNGVAFKSSEGDYVVFNDNYTFTNVGNMIIDMPVMVMPVSVDDIEEGDIIRHNDQYVIVEEIKDDTIWVVKPWVKEKTAVVPEINIFGFSYYTKVMNFFDVIGDTPNKDNPFGNMLPFMLISQDGDTKNDMTIMMMLMAMNGGEMNFDNPFMMMMLMGGDTKIDPMMMMLMMNSEMFGKKCNCRGKRTELQPVNELTQEEMGKLMTELEKSFTTVMPLEKEE